LVHIQGSGLFNWDNIALVTPSGELVITGSVLRTPEAQTQDILVGNDTNQLLTEILKEAKMINFYV